jgi:hypothetical protein
MTAGYSGTPLPNKLGIKPDGRFCVLHAPDGFDSTLDVLPAGAIWVDALEAGIDDWQSLTDAVAPAGTVWVCWPKRASKLPTDITEDVLRQLLLPTGWVDNKVCAVDATWSGLRFALRRELR